MKKFLSRLCALAIAGAAVAGTFSMAGCGDEAQYKIGILLYNFTDIQGQQIESYASYLEDNFDVSFTYVAVGQDDDSHIQGLESCINQGCNAVFSGYNTAIDRCVEMCESAGVYYGLLLADTATSSISEDALESKYFLGGVKQFSISETQKFGHVTYFFNGNKTGKFDDKLEEYVEIPSDIVPFEQRPWMKCAEIADRVISEIESGKWDFIKLNFPNGDMVGHTGVFEAVVCSMEAMDIQIGRIWDAVKAAGGIMVVTADHGNADDMYEHGKDGSLKLRADGEPKSKTSHSLNPVPCIICDAAYNGEYSKTLNEGLGISSIATTCITLLGFVPPADYDKSVVTLN